MSQFSLLCRSALANTYFESLKNLKEIGKRDSRIMEIRQLKATMTGSVLCVILTTVAFAQKDPGVRGGLQNTGGGLQHQGIMIPHPPLISQNPKHPELKVWNQVGVYKTEVRDSSSDHARSLRSQRAPSLGVPGGHPIANTTRRPAQLMAFVKCVLRAGT